MSLITCCPTCQTMFKVSGEDLRVSDGWVRCGKCDGVFDASAHLQMMPPEQELATQVDATQQTTDFRAATEVQAAPSFSGLQNALSDFAGVSQNPPATANPAEPSGAFQAAEPAESPMYAAPSAPSARFPAEERASLFRAAASGDGGTGTASAVEPAFAADPDDLPIGLRPESAPDRVELRREDRSGRPAAQDGLGLRLKDRPLRRRSRRGALAVLLVLAVLLALIAWVRQERQALIQAQPAWLVPMESLCRLLACEVQAPRMLDAIAIEGVTLSEPAASEYKIELVLKNTKNHAVSVPGLNVSLSPLEGQAHRHTALPPDFAPGLTQLTAGGQLRVALSFKVALPPAADAGPAAATPAVAAAPASELPSPPVSPTLRGFRVTAFYP